eukprot:514308_1
MNVTLAEKINSTLNPNETRLISRDNGCKANVRIQGQLNKSRYLYHALLDIPYAPLLLLIFVSFLCFNLIFALLLYWNSGVLNVNTNKNATDTTNQWQPCDVSFSDAFFLSFQSMDTIGFGGLQPNGPLANWIVFIESFVSNVFFVFFTALVFAKLTRPSRLIRQMKFSEYAVINSQMNSFVAHRKNNDFYENGQYELDTKHQCLSFRFGSMRRSKFCESNLSLLYFERETKPATEFENYRFIEMSFEINEQMNRVRSMALSQPLLPLPYTVVHKIDEHSPLFGLTKPEMMRKKSEIIAVFGAIDGATSDNFQSWYSYVASDIVLGAQFEPMVTSKIEEYLGKPKEILFINYDHISKLSKVPRCSV